MNVSKHRSMLVVATALLVATVMLFTGCSKSPLEPNLEPSQPQVLSRGAAFASFVDGPQGSPLSMYTEQVIPGKNGGRLELFDVILDIPPRALPADTLYSISIPDVNAFYNVFGTDGLVFKTPVTVTMSYRDADLTGVNESTIRIGWWDEDDEQWVDMVCELDRVNKVVTGKLYHFSAYALVSD